MLFNKVYLGVLILCFIILSCKKKNVETNEQVLKWVTEGVKFPFCSDVPDFEFCKKKIMSLNQNL